MISNFLEVRKSRGGKDHYVPATVSPGYIQKQCIMTHNAPLPMWKNVLYRWIISNVPQLLQ